jgi:hypothetical protein
MFAFDPPLVLIGEPMTAVTAGVTWIIRMTASPPGCTGIS